MDAIAGARIHPTAEVSRSAVLGEGVTIGAYAIVEEGALLGEGCRVDTHAIVRTGAQLGARNTIHPFAVIGGDPQDRRYGGEATALVIGEGNVFREHVTVHRGTAQGGGVTRIGSGGLFMAGVHVAHDAEVGDGVTLANGTLLGGHVKLGDHAVTGGMVAIAPFARIGRRSFLAGGAMVERAVPPFVIAAGDRARVRALNRVGLTRGSIPASSIAALERAFRVLFRTNEPRVMAARRLAEDPDPLVCELAAFILDHG